MDFPNELLVSVYTVNGCMRATVSGITTAIDAINRAPHSLYSGHFIRKVNIIWNMVVISYLISKDIDAWCLYFNYRIHA